MLKSSVIIIFLAALVCQSSAQTRDCPENCLIRFRCNPYYKELVWSIVDGFCRVFQNGCLFATENCSRLNSCKEAMVQTTREQCQQKCNAICAFGGSGVCASFAETHANGTTEWKSKSFLNTCLLNQYSCLNGIAYIGSPSDGKCREY